MQGYQGYWDKGRFRSIRKTKTMMRRALWLGILLAVTACAQDVVSTSLRADIILNGTWGYVLNQAQTSIPSSGWISTRAPQLPFEDGTSAVWYQRTFHVPASWASQSGRRFFIELEKCGHYCAIYMNGKLVGYHFGQFSPYEAEVTSQLLAGQVNVINVYAHKADTTYVRSGANVDQSSCPTSHPDCIADSYRPSGMTTVKSRNWVGLVGDVKFSWRPAQYISDISIVTSVRQLTIGDQVSVTGTGAAVSVQSEVLDNGTPVLVEPAVPLVLGSATSKAAWANPTLWGPAPYGQAKLYTFRTRLLDSSGNTVDEIYTQFGFREVWVSGTSVMLNGKKLWMAGSYFSPLVSIRAINDRRPQAFQLFIMQQSGLNTLQHHWDDVGRSWLELADEMGMLVLDSFYCTGTLDPTVKVDNLAAWTAFMQQAALEWATANKNHPSVILLRPMDVGPGGAQTTVLKTKVYPALDAAIHSVDTTRPIVDGTDVDAWGQSEASPTNPAACDNGSALAAQLAIETKPLLVKEIYGSGLPCTSSFLNTIYGVAYTGGAVGLIYQQLSMFTPQQFQPSWFSMSGRGNRSTTYDPFLPNWVSRQWTPSHWSTQFATLYKTHFQPQLLNTSPTSGDYGVSGLPLNAESVFLIPPAGQGNPTGAVAAQDGTGTAWITTPVVGNYQLDYSDGTHDVTTGVTVTAPPPF